MKITHAQLAVVAQALKLADIDPKLVVHLRQYPEGQAGELALSVRDGWSGELVVIARDGSTRRPSARVALTPIPGQTSIPGV